MHCGAPERLEAEIAGDIGSEVCEFFPFSRLIDAMCRLDQRRPSLFLRSCRMGASSSGMCSISRCRVDVDLAYHRDVSSLLRLFFRFSAFAMQVFNVSLHFMMSSHLFTPC